MPEKRVKTAQINWRVDPKLKAVAEALAKEEGRTLTNWIEKLITDVARKKKLWPPKD